MLRVMGIVVLLLTTAQDVAVPQGLTGTWRAEDTTMGPRGASMASALGTEAMVARPAAAREIVIVDRGDTIELEVPGGAEAMRWTLPVNAAATSVSDAQGKTMRAQAVRDGTALVIRREHQVSLPGGGEVTVEIEERHELLADSTLRVQTTSKAGAQQQVHVATYRRVK